MGIYDSSDREIDLPQTFRDSLQIQLLMLSEFKRIN